MPDNTASSNTLVYNFFNLKKLIYLAVDMSLHNVGIGHSLETIWFF